MDLRRRLAWRLAGVSAAVTIAAAAALLLSARSDVENEMLSSARLADLTLAATGLGCQADGGDVGLALRRLLDASSLRHVRVALVEPGAPLPGGGEELGPAWLVRLFAETPTAIGERRVRVGSRDLVVHPNPASEINEIVQDLGRVMLIFALSFLVTVISVWLAADRALAPVRSLVDGILRVGRGDRDIALPRYELREFSDIATAIGGLARDLDAAREEQRRLARQLIALQESERSELARELHDQLGQTLTVIGVAAAFVERHAADAPAARLAECGREIAADARSISRHVRGLLARLRPYSLEGMGLRHALEELVDSWRSRSTGLAFATDFADTLPPIDQDASLALYRVAQEAITNVVRHAGASRCVVTIANAAGCIALSVEDDGGGRREALLGAMGGGLLGMRERVEMAGGSFDIEDIGERGIRIRARIAIQTEGVPT